MLFVRSDMDDLLHGSRDAPCRECYADQDLDRYDDQDEESYGDALGGTTRSLATAQRLPPTYAGAPRNAPCPCGSGMKFKKCHWLQ
jgi:hypothetical protein